MGLGNTSARSNPILLVKEITDTYLRQNFQSLSDYFSSENQLLGFKFFDLSFPSAVSNFKVQHGLTTIPQDILVSKIVGSGNVQFNHGLFDATNLDITVTGSCRIRFYAGSYWNPQSTQIPAVTDQTTYTPSPGGGTTNVNQIFVPVLGNENLNNEYFIQPSDDYIFSNPKNSSGMTLYLPLASTVTNKIITVQSMSLNNYLTTVRVQTSDVKAFIDQQNILATQINRYKAEVKFVSDGTIYRTVGNFLDIVPNSGPTETRLTTGTALTYTPPQGCKWIRVRMVGGGGGGGGGGTGSPGAGGNGTATTFVGTGINFSCGGGQGGGNGGASNGGTGGTNTFTGGVGESIQGGSGQPGANTGITGGNGAPTPFCGGGMASSNGIGGTAGVVNTGVGGGGGSAASNPGGGGGAGGFINAIIVNPAASYTYTIGALGAAGTAGTGAGGSSAGATGVIVIEEYYH